MVSLLGGMVGVRFNFKIFSEEIVSSCDAAIGLTIFSRDPLTNHRYWLPASGWSVEHSFELKLVFLKFRRKEVDKWAFAVRGPLSYQNVHLRKIPPCDSING